MDLKSYFNISNEYPGIDPIYDTDPETGHIIDATITAHDHEIIIRGYLSAADIVISHCENNKEYINLDYLLFPVLFLSLSILEFCLKIILNKLIEHSAAGCPFLIETTNKIETNHEISKLFESLQKIYNSNKLPQEHVFTDMDLLEHIVQEFGKHQIESVKMRYLTDRTKNLYDIYKKGVTCDFKRLYLDIKKIADSTINYICSYELAYCNDKEYSLNRYNELKHIYKLMVKFSEITAEYRKKHKCSEIRVRQNKIIRGEDPDCFTLADADFSLLNYRKFYTYDKFNSEELTLLVMGIYFNCYPRYSFENFELIDKWSKEDKIQKLDSRAIWVNNCLSNLKIHIKRIKSILSYVKEDSHK